MTPGLYDENMELKINWYELLNRKILKVEQGTVYCLKYDISGFLVLPDYVLRIGELGFSNCDHLTGIEIPTSVFAIQRYAFNKCTSLTSVIIPNSVQYFDDCVFQDCKNLLAVQMSDNVKQINWNMFLGCFKLDNVYWEGQKYSLDDLNEYEVFY